MSRFVKFGDFFFALALILFGIQHLLAASLIKGPVPGPPWVVKGFIATCLIGIVLCAGGVSVAMKKQTPRLASCLWILFLLYLVIHYAPALLEHPRAPGLWTSTFEVLAMTGVSLVIAGAWPSWQRLTKSWESSDRSVTYVGQSLYAISLMVFGVQHFMYAPFVASLIPPWIPARLFFAYFTGLAFIAAAIAILLRMRSYLATVLLGAMFFLWVVLLHLPRVLAKPGDGDEWTSLGVALAMSGGALIIARSNSQILATRPL